MSAYPQATRKRSPAKSGSAFNSTRKRKKKRPVWVTLLVIAITVLIVAGSALWIAAFKFYNVISNSMAPTLIGGEFDRDKLVCWMLSFPGRLPRRWEVVLFDTPEIGANRQLIPGFDIGGQQGVTVKRAVGLPGERLAIANGDIWTRPIGGGTYVRQIKPDHVQRGLWISVYEEDFAELTVNELAHFWEFANESGVSIAPGGPLSLIPGEERCGMTYRPVTRTGGSGAWNLEILPGIPDRYVLLQDVIFNCATKECGANFSVTVRNQKLQGRCPRCGQLSFENRIAFYGFRSGLPEIGPYAAGHVAQEDPKHNRGNSYFFVPDLRVRTDIRLASPDSSFVIALRMNNKEDTVRLSRNTAEVNGVAIPLGNALTANEWTSVEFYRVDGALRLFLNGGEKPLFDQIVHVEEKPDTQETGKTNGVSMFAEGGGVIMRNIAIDRDIYYFSGTEHAIENYLSGMEDTGEVNIPDGTFFPMGDNTTVSLDARSWGPVNLDLLTGTALRIVQPTDRARAIPMPES